MRVIVLGAGVVGVTTAYYLSQLGYEVTVVDRASAVGDGASFANAGQLSYSFTDALAKPEFLANIPRLLLGRDPGVRVRVSPSLLAWGLRFVAQCTTKQARRNTLAVLKIAMRSAELMSDLRESLPFDFSHRKAGKLVLLSNESELAAARVASATKRSYGCETTTLTRDEALATEPALQHMSDEFIAAVYSESDAVADAREFTKGLSGWLETQGSVDFRLSSHVRKLVTRNGRAYGVEIDGETLESDAVVVCLGAWSHALLGTAGINPHVYPVRGYSITLPPGIAAPTVSITSLKHRMVYSRINGFLRVAGYADFTGFDTSADDERIRSLAQLARRLAPLAADYDTDNTRHWGGFRPMTPNGQPRVGQTGVDGLFVNTGHGMLGWTLACATGHEAAQAVAKAH